GVLLGGCSDEGETGEESATPGPAATGEGFRSADCNGVTDADITDVAGPGLYRPAVVSDAGCFWQEDTMIDDFGAGMGISTWWYRGSD
ncbi:DUF3558 domain-containing protein, partial [Enterococcus faecium]